MKKLIFNITFHWQIEQLKYHLNNLFSWNISSDCGYVITTAHKNNFEEIKKESSQEDINNALTIMMLKDYDMIKEYLPEKCGNLLDIGCGIGLIDIAIYNHYKGGVFLNLLDKNNRIDENTSIRGFNKNYVFYNSMEATEKTLISNGVKKDSLKTYQVELNELEEIGSKKYDLIISLLSCGWHYSVTTYLDLIKNSLSENGVLILDIRNNTGELEILEKDFYLIKEIINTAESKHDGGTVGNRFVLKKK